MSANFSDLGFPFASDDSDVEEACPEDMLLDGDCNSDDDIDADCI